MAKLRYEGGCHCGRVRFVVHGDLSTATVCSCSICSKKGFIHLIVLPQNFELVSGREDLATYEFNSRVEKERSQPPERSFPLVELDVRISRIRLLWQHWLQTKVQFAELSARNSLGQARVWHDKGRCLLGIIVANGKHPMFLLTVPNIVRLVLRCHDFRSACEAKRNQYS